MHLYPAHKTLDQGQRPHFIEVLKLLLKFVGPVEFGLEVLPFLGGVKGLGEIIGVGKEHSFLIYNHQVYQDLGFLVRQLMLILRFEE